MDDYVDFYLSFGILSTKLRRGMEQKHWWWFYSNIHVWDMLIHTHPSHRIRIANFVPLYYNVRFYFHVQSDSNHTNRLFACKFLLLHQFLWCVCSCVYGYEHCQKSDLRKRKNLIKTKNWWHKYHTPAKVCCSLYDYVHEQWNILSMCWE